MHTIRSLQPDPHGNRFSLRNPVMAILVALLWLLTVLNLGMDLQEQAPRALVLASRWLTYAVLALGIFHVIIGGLRDLRRAGPAAPRGFRFDRRSLTFGWLFCLVVALLAFELSPTPTSGLHDTALIFGGTAVVGMVLELIRSRRNARDY